MTDIPKIGFLCSGKTPLELSVSIHCAYKIMESMRVAGFMNGGCYTEILDVCASDKIKKAAAIIERLCLYNELVITVGCEGFSSGDIIPDITDVVATKKAVYFADTLCGSRKIEMPAGRRQESDGKLRIFPDNARDDARTVFQENAKRNTRLLSDRIERAFSGLTVCLATPGKSCDAKDESAEPERNELNRAAVMRVLSHSRADFVKRQRQRALQPKEPENKTEYIRLPPSRASAGILKKSLILNFSNDIFTAVPLAEALTPAINFAVYNISGKSAADIADFEKKLKSSVNYDDYFNSNGAVNN